MPYVLQQADLAPGLGVDARCPAGRGSPVTHSQVDPDGLLVEGAQQGNLSAYEDLVRRHRDALFGYLRRMAGDPGVAEELAQATFVRAWESLGGFRREAWFKTWLFRIAHSLCVNRLTRNRPTAELREDMADPSGGEPPEALRRRRLSGVVESALNQLRPDQRACLVLAVYEEMSYQEISRAIGKSPRAVDSLLVRARRELRRLLEPARRSGLV
jgi:RNA polymerase sigma-70 factor, ECF subfamily